MNSLRFLILFIALFSFAAAKVSSHNKFDFSMLISGLLQKRRVVDDYDYYDDDNYGAEGDNFHRRSDSYGGGGGGGGGGNPVDVLAPLVLLAPLAGLASLYAAAAINSNSALITLAVLNNNGRKKRDVGDEENFDEFDSSMKTLEKIGVNATDVAQKLLVDHMTCNGLFEDACLARVGCLLASVETGDVFLNDLMRNRFIDDAAKREILNGHQNGQNCHRFICRIY